MLGSVVHGVIDRRVYSAAASQVAAWFLEGGDGCVLYGVNCAACQTPGARHYAESWFRLNAIVRVRPFGVLLTAEVAQVAGLLDAYTHTLV